MINKSVLVAILLFVFSSVSYAEIVKLTSLDWPPYTNESLKEKGASVAVAKAAFAAAGHELVVEFYPWKRAVYLAKEDAGYDGYFPEYFSEELKKEFILSNPMGSGPLGFAELKSNSITWNDLNDLKKYRVGVVSGYVNTAAFDSMVAKGQLKVSAASDDIKNLLKLASGRSDLAVIDKNVLSFILSSDAKLKSVASTIQFNSHLLEDKQLYICFKKGSRGEKISKAFNEGLGKIDVNAIMKSHLGN